MKTPPHPPFSQRPACPLRGPLRGGRARGEGGALGSRAASLDLTFARNESLGARFGVEAGRAGPPGLGSQQAPTGARVLWLGTPPAHRPRVSSYSDRRHIYSFSQFFLQKSVRLNIEYSKIVSWNVL